MQIQDSDFYFDYSTIPDTDPWTQSGFSILDNGGGANVKVLDGVLLAKTNTTAVYFHKSGNTAMTVGEVKMRFSRLSTANSVAGVAIMDSSGNGYRAIFTGGNRIQLHRLNAFSIVNTGGTPTPVFSWYTGAELSLRFEVIEGAMHLSACLNGNPYLTITDSSSPHLSNLKPSWVFSGSLNNHGINAIGVNKKIILPTYQTFEVGYSAEAPALTSDSTDSCANIMLVGAGSLPSPNAPAAYGVQILEVSVEAENIGIPQAVNLGLYGLSNSQVLGEKIFPGNLSTDSVSGTLAWHAGISLGYAYDAYRPGVDRVALAYQKDSGDTRVAFSELGTPSSESKPGALPISTWGAAGTDSNFVPHLKMTVSYQVWPSPAVVGDLLLSSAITMIPIESVAIESKPII